MSGRGKGVKGLGKGGFFDTIKNKKSRQQLIYNYAGDTSELKNNLNGYEITTEDVPFFINNRNNIIAILIKKKKESLPDDYVINKIFELMFKENGFNENIINKIIAQTGENYSQRKKILNNKEKFLEDYKEKEIENNFEMSPKSVDISELANNFESENDTEESENETEKSEEKASPKILPNVTANPLPEILPKVTANPSPRPKVTINHNPKIVPKVEPRLLPLPPKMKKNEPCPTLNEEDASKFEYIAKGNVACNRYIKCKPGQVRIDGRCTKTNKTFKKIGKTVLPALLPKNNGNMEPPSQQQLPPTLRLENHGKIPNAKRNSRVLITKRRKLEQTKKNLEQEKMKLKEKLKTCKQEFNRHCSTIKRRKQ